MHSSSDADLRTPLNTPRRLTHSDSDSHDPLEGSIECISVADVVSNLPSSATSGLSLPSGSVPGESDSTTLTAADLEAEPQKQPFKIPRLPVTLRALFIAFFIHTLSIGMQAVANPKLQLHIADGSSSKAARTNAYISVATGVLGFFLGPLFGSLSDVYGRRPFLLFSLLCFSVALTFVGLSYNLLGLVVSQCIMAAFDTSNSVTYAVVSDMVPSKDFVQIYTIFGAAAGVGILVGPPLALGCMEINETSAVYLFAMMLTMVNLAWLWKQLPETLHWQKRLEQSRSEAQDDLSNGSAAGTEPKDTLTLNGESSSEHVHIQVDGEAQSYASAPSDEVRPVAASAAAPSPSQLEDDPRLQQPVPFYRDRPFTLRAIMNLPTSNPLRSVGIMWHSGSVLRRLSLSIVLHLLSDGVLNTVVFLYTDARWGWGTMENTGLIGSAGAAGIVIMAVIGPWMRMSPRFGEERMYRIAQLLTIGTQVAFALTPWGWLIYPMAVFGSFTFLWTPTLRARISRQVDVPHQGELQGAVSCISSIASTFSAVGSNALFSVTADKDSSFYFPGFVFLVAAGLNVLAVAAEYGLDTRGTTAEEEGDERDREPTPPNDANEHDETSISTADEKAVASDDVDGEYAQYSQWRD